LAFDGSGNAILVWAQYQNSRQTIWASRYSASTKVWSSPQQISDATPAADAAGPSVAMDNSGNAIAVWTEGTGVSGIESDVWVARYDVATSSWIAPAIISDTNTHSASNGQVAVNALGQGIVGWAYLTMNCCGGELYDIYARSITTAGVWGGALTRINTIPATSASPSSNSTSADYYFSLAMDASGNGAALFVQNNATTNYSDASAAMYSVSEAGKPQV
jgi:hypothetical protein